MGVILGCIADDFTGATDLASFLVSSGMRTVQIAGLPEERFTLPDVDAVVLALKSRTQKIEDAVADSLSALTFLQDIGCRQFYFKYCSTFDSTEQGNIGPVADALLDVLGSPFTLACPALPVNGRTIYNGYLFVNGRLLSESGMENHPLTPMRDSDLVRFLGKQTDGKVGLVNSTTVKMGAEAISTALSELEKTYRYAIVDALTDNDMLEIGHGCRNLKLVTGGSGLAAGLVDNYVEEGLLVKSKNSDRLDNISGNTLILSGSCSSATQEQVAVYRENGFSLKLDPVAIKNGDQTLDHVIDWLKEYGGADPALIYSTDTPEAIRECQEQLGAEEACSLIEMMFAEIVKEAVKWGVRKIIVAGGETSGSVVQALNVNTLRIGPAIAPGVPVTQTITTTPMLLALKSGNFGDRDFFRKAVEMMS